MAAAARPNEARTISLLGLRILLLFLQTIARLQRRSPVREFVVDITLSQQDATSAALVERIQLFAQNTCAVSLIHWQRVRNDG
jgi:hypothetical protein